MSELFEDDDRIIVVEDEHALEAEKILSESHHHSFSDARRRLESIMEEKRLKNELEDYPEAL